MPPPQKRTKYSGRFLLEWKELFDGVIVPAKNEQYARCDVCNRDIKVAASGVYDVKEHLKSSLHKKNAEERKGQQRLTSFVKPQTSTSATRSEVMVCNFIAQHNLPLSVADHMCELLPKLCPDSQIAKKIACKRTKTTQIVKACLAQEATEKVIEHCKHRPFSLMIDESNDRRTEKRLAILVRLFTASEGTKTRLLDMPVCNDGRAEAIFNTLDELLRYFFLLLFLPIVIISWGWRGEGGD